MLFKQMKRMKDMIKAVRTAYANWAENAEHARAARELHTLSDRELSDLGIGRGEIWRAVREGSKRNAGIFL